ncbi:hypothetical protein D1632_08680 [Chryseobacterium nematophagum]|uniref:Uncharacterized protein n=1 Tax=Chryseobacterium nematophagum TaxID=2305228 RepID=A0A3M7LBV0_9FLAO|nr:hypothetical protein [Chryseobacterium nematophagum]RMZ59689.1 hypothetical protein D1632_08680 [Chryseobacterium nematophagum]
MKLKILKLITLYLVLFSCNGNNTNSNLGNQLYNALIDYQEKNPIPAKENTSKTFFLISKNLIYIYEVTFYKDGSVYITLNPSGVSFEKKSYGIYKNHKLKATYIIDDDKIGQNFVKKYLNKDLDKYTLSKAPMIDVTYPTYIYKIKGEKLVFYDSIRGNVRR